MSQQGSIRWRGRTDGQGRPVKGAGSYTEYWFVPGPDGQRVQRTKGGFRTKDEARGHLTEVLGSLQSGSYVEPRKVSVSSWVRDTWLPARRSEGLRPSTIASYETVMEKWVLPRIGGVQLSQLTAKTVQKLYDDLRSDGSTLGRGGLSGRSVQYAATVLRMALQYAVRQQALSRNPAAQVRRPKAEQAEMQAWSAQEAGAFLKSVAKDRLYAAWLLLLTRGPRRGEMVGLRWSDVDLEASRLSIVRTRVLVKGKESTSSPKTDAGRRTIPLDAQLVAALKAHKVRQKEERLQWGPAWTDSGHVFTREDGTPLHPEYLSTAFEGHVKAAKLRSIRLHDLRHTAATLALKAGIPTEYVAQWLGHSSASITRDLYQHVTPSMSEEAAARLTALVLGG
jgi:integrase